MFCQRLGFQIGSHARKTWAKSFVFDTSNLKIPTKNLQSKTCSISNVPTISSPFCFFAQVSNSTLPAVQKTNAQSA